MDDGTGDGHHPETSLLGRRQYLRLAGALTSGVTTAGSVTAAADGPAVEATTTRVDDRWWDVQSTASYATPVVVAPSLSYHGTDPASPRVRNVTAGSFELTVEEWRYLDGDHVPETVGCLVTDAGTHTLSSGAPFEAGQIRTDHQWTTVSFDASFASPPVVFANAQTRNGGDPVVTRIRNLTRSGMEVRVQEAEARGVHLAETLGYVAVPPDTSAIAGYACETGTVAGVTHGWQTISFANGYPDGVFLASMQTYRGSNTATVRYRNHTDASVEVKIEEERSRDRETAHVGERVGYLVIEPASTQDGYGLGGYGDGGYGA